MLYISTYSRRKESFPERWTAWAQDVLWLASTYEGNIDFPHTRVRVKRTRAFNRKTMIRNLEWRRVYWKPTGVLKLQAYSIISVDRRVIQRQCVRTFSQRCAYVCVGNNTADEREFTWFPESSASGFLAMLNYNLNWISHQIQSQFYIRNFK